MSKNVTHELDELVNSIETSLSSMSARPEDINKEHELVVKMLESKPEYYWLIPSFMNMCDIDRFNRKYSNSYWVLEDMMFEHMLTLQVTPEEFKRVVIMRHGELDSAGTYLFHSNLFDSIEELLIKHPDKKDYIVQCMKHTLADINKTEDCNQCFIEWLQKNEEESYDAPSFGLPDVEEFLSDDHAHQEMEKIEEARQFQIMKT